MPGSVVKSGCFSCFTVRAFIVLEQHQIHYKAVVRFHGFAVCAVNADLLLLPLTSFTDIRSHCFCATTAAAAAPLTAWYAFMFVVGRQLGSGEGAVG